MTEQRTPEALSTQEENNLICEKLLGWKPRKCFSPYDGRFMGYDFLDGKRETTAPSFTTWADAGLILDELQKRSYDARGAADVLLELGDKLIGALLTPAAIRAATLAYVRSLP